MRPSISLCLERLEDRDVPAFFGTPWVDASQLSLSFVPDGTSVGSQQTSDLDASDLDAAFAAQGIDTAVWQGEILRAVQSWLSVANIDVHVIEEEVPLGGGHALGTAGFSQGDFRFGDLRIAGAPLGPKSLAMATPYDPVLGTWSGDIVINTTEAFTTTGEAGKYDLYTTVLQEVGHALGVKGNLNEPDSVMFNYYVEPRQGLWVSNDVSVKDDVDAIQRLYGVRQADRFEVDTQNNITNNDTFATAYKFMRAARQTYRTDLKTLEPNEASYDGPPPLNIYGDITTATDTDWFWYKVRGAETNPDFEIQLDTADFSLAHLQLDVYQGDYDTNGQLIGVNFVQTADVDGLASITATAGATYFFKVSAVGDDFAIGRYNLLLSPNSEEVAGRLETTFNNVYATLSAHDTSGEGEAAAMKRTDQSTGARPNWVAQGILDPDLRNEANEVVNDVDVYSVTSPAAAGLVQITLSLSDSSSQAFVSLVDDRGTDLGARVVASGNGTYVIEANYAASTTGTPYYLRVVDVNNSGVAYRLHAQFKVPEEADIAPTFTDTIGEEIPATPPETPLTADDFKNALQSFRTMELTATELLDIQFTAAGAGGSVVVEVYDNNSLGNPDPTPLYATDQIMVGETIRLQWLLGPGSYTFRIVAGTEYEDGDTGVGFGPITFNMTVRMANDPIGPQIMDPSAPPPRQLAPTWSETSSTIINILKELTNPYGRPFGSYVDKWY